MQRVSANIAVLHHTGGGNLGDQACVDTVITNIRQRWPDSAIALLSMNSSETAKIHGIPSYPLRAYTWGLGYESASSENNVASKLTRGAMFDVVLDLRTESSTYGKWYGLELSAENARMLYGPEPCTHGCQTLQEETEMHYLTSAFYTAGPATGVRFDDPAFAIQWPLPPTVISEQDRSWPPVNS